MNDQLDIFQGSNTLQDLEKLILKLEELLSDIEAELELAIEMTEFYWHDESTVALWSTRRSALKKRLGELYQQREKLKDGSNGNGADDEGK